jgi:hypothetical protein
MKNKNLKNSFAFDKNAKNNLGWKWELAPKIKEYIDKTKYSAHQVSLRLGKSKNYIQTMISTLADLNKDEKEILLEEEARKRMLNPMEKIPQGNKGLASQQAGKLFNVNERYVREAKKLQENNPKLLEEVRLGHKNFSEIKKGNKTFNEAYFP